MFINDTNNIEWYMLMTLLILNYIILLMTPLIFWLYYVINDSANDE